MKKSVCEECNRFFGENYENWFLMYSPIGTWRDQFIKPNTIQIRNLKYILNYAWFDNVKEWVVLNHNNGVKDVMASQVILKSDDELVFAHLDIYDSEDEAEKVYQFLVNSIEEQSFKAYISKQLPEDFNPRVLLHNNKAFVAAKSSEDANRIVERIKAKRTNKTSEREETTVGLIKNYRVHYKWSVKKYLKWATKIAYEFLVLITKGEIDLNTKFKNLKNYIRYPTDDDYTQTIPFEDGKGFRMNRFTPNGWMALVEMEEMPDFNKIPVFNTNKSSAHKIFIYQFKGWLFCTIQLFDIHPAQIVLCKLDYDLPNFYYIEYDILKDKLRFFSSKKQQKNSLVTLGSIYCDEEMMMKLFNEEHH